MCERVCVRVCVYEYESACVCVVCTCVSVCVNMCECVSLYVIQKRQKRHTRTELGCCAAEQKI